MKRIVALLGLSAAAVGGTATLAPARTIAHRATTTTIQLRRTALGTILVDSHGHTLYVFTRDRPKRDTCAAIDGCPTVWPALRTSAKPTGSRGVRALLLSTAR